jgi:phospholipase/lecithinase/hemolysin
VTRFQPKFEELLNKYTEKLGPVFGGGASGTPVVMVVKTTYTEPGYNVYVSSAPAMINLEITFKKGGVEAAKITLNGAPGSTYGGYDFDTGLRISEAYAKAGKELGRFITKMAAKDK